MFASESTDLSYFYNWIMANFNQMLYIVNPNDYCKNDKKKKPLKFSFKLYINIKWKETWTVFILAN